MPTATSWLVASTVLKTGLDVTQQRKTERAEEKRASVERAMQGEQAVRRRRGAIREAMIKRAQIENVAGATGQSGSSAVLSSSQDVIGQTQRNLADLSTSMQLGNQLTTAEEGVLRARTPSPLQNIARAGQNISGRFLN